MNQSQQFDVIVTAGNGAGTDVASWAVDVVNPVLFAFMVYAADTQRPVVTSSAVLLGHTAAYFGAGIVIALGLEKITHYLANPSSIDYLIALIVGLLLLWVA